MLNDRDYMRGSGGDFRSGAAGGMQALVVLILANVIFYLLFSLGGSASGGLCLSAAGIRQGAYHQLLSAMFMHADFFHLFFNMFSLYVFGSLAAPILGARRFLTLYFISGLAGNLLWLATAWNSPGSELLGASGAVMGVIAASAMMMPDVNMFLLFIPFPIKLRTMAVVFIILEIFNQLNAGPLTTIAYTAHIGGFFSAVLLMHFCYRRFVQWDPLRFLSPGQTAREPRRSPQPPPSGWSVSGGEYAPPPPPPTGRVTQKELDRLLDKISAGGINSLSEDELARLRLAREQMRGGGGV